MVVHHAGLVLVSECLRGLTLTQTLTRIGGSPDTPTQTLFVFVVHTPTLTLTLTLTLTSTPTLTLALKGGCQVM